MRIPPFKKALFIAGAVALSTLLALAAVEAGLRWLDGAQAAPQGLDYGDVWRQAKEGRPVEKGPGGYLKEGFRGRVIDGYGGRVLWVNNSQGFRAERDFDARPAPGGRRILSLGDSFTVGYRVGQSETFSKLIEEWSSREIGPTEVLVSCTEDPPQGADYLRRFAPRWNPHLALLGLTLGNDIAQSYAVLNPASIGFAHGLQKFEIPGDCLRGDRGWLHWIRRSHLVGRMLPVRGIGSWYGGALRPKLFDPVNGLGVFLAEPPPRVETAYQRLFHALRQAREATRERGIELAVLIFPQRYQVQPDDWGWTLFEYRLREECFDLGLPNRRIAEFCRREGMTCIDPTEAMRRHYRENGRSLYLPNADMHWNPRGHRVFFESVRNRLRPLIERLPTGPAGKSGGLTGRSQAIAGARPARPEE